MKKKIPKYQTHLICQAEPREQTIYEHGHEKIVYVVLGSKLYGHFKGWCWVRFGDPKYKFRRYITQTNY